MDDRNKSVYSTFDSMFQVTGSQSDADVLGNRLVVHHNDIAANRHVLVKSKYAMTTQ